MSETNGDTITAAPGILKFAYGDPPKVIEVDVVEAKLMVDQLEKQVNGLAEQLKELQQWAKSFGHDITTSQAYQLRLGIEAGWEAFKKKLPPSLASLITTRSTPRPSTETPMQPSKETSHDSLPKTNSDNDGPREGLHPSMPTT